MFKKVLLATFLASSFGVAMADSSNLSKDPAPSAATAQKEIQRDTNSKQVNQKKAKKQQQKAKKQTPQMLDSQNTKDGK
ncbi:hypothetical protein [Neisseria sp. Ec49-e6-T10]|uniref:hypothetical protein n=1 Tax=Neisseria sp. Ec49-e6-T10 TaxID=3140744 RepID=UPI003EBE3879